MICPRCQKELKQALFYNTEVDYCPNCLGLFFEEDELRFAKDEKDRNLVWLDIDLWRDEKKFKLNLGMRLCPYCRVPLYEVFYGSSNIVVDVCNICKGIWLDRGEFKKIINYLKENADKELLEKYSKNLFYEFKEIFSGPETIREEINDFLVLLKLLNYKFMARHPLIGRLIIELFK
jgi:Zn-finger nucleic acid-binding protein